MLARVGWRARTLRRRAEEANAAFDNDKNRPGGLVLLGHIAVEEGKLDDALRYFDQASALLQSTHRRPLPQLSFFRGDTLARMGRADEAEQAFLTEIRLFPTEPQAYKNLILLYTTEGRTQEATKLVFALEKAAPTAPSYVAISETLKTIGDINGSRFWAQRGLGRYPGDRQLKALLRG